MTKPHTRDWIDYALAVAPFLALLASFGVGLTQLYLQRKILQYNLYDKRYRVFMAVQKILNAKNFTDNANALLEALRLETAEVSYLFGNDIKQLLEEIDSVLREVRWQEHELNEADATNQKEFGTALIHWVALAPKSDELFRRYLQLYDARSWFRRLDEHLDKKMKERERHQAEIG